MSRGKIYFTKNDIKFMEENIIRISNLAKEYDFVGLVTNQPSISMGKLSIERLDSINSTVISIAFQKV